MRPVYEAILVVAVGLALVLLSYQTGYQQGYTAAKSPTTTPMRWCPGYVSVCLHEASHCYPEAACIYYRYYPLR